MEIRVVDPTRPRHFVRDPAWQVQYLPECDDQGLYAFHFVVKRGYDIRPGGMATPAQPQSALYLSDFYYDDAEPLGSAIRYESDLSPPKTACDVIVNGWCHPPGGEAVQCLVGVKVGPLDKQVLVLGDRSAWWKPGLRRPVVSRARPFHTLPIRYEYAYGGSDLRHTASPVMCPTNPIGTGFWVQEYDPNHALERWGPLPNLEDPDDVVQVDDLLVPAEKLQDGDKFRRPAGFGVVPRHWAPRVNRGGMDPKLRPVWDLFAKIPRRQKVDLPARIMEPRFLQAAPEGQTIPYPRGAEAVTITNMHPELPELRFQLPADRPVLRFDFGKGMSPVELNIDTLIIEPETLNLQVVWRGSLRVAPGQRMDQLNKALVEVDGHIALPAALLDTGFPIELLTRGQP